MRQHLYFVVALFFCLSLAMGAEPAHDRLGGPSDRGRPESGARSGSPQGLRPPLTLKVDVSLVSVDVIVRNRNGAIIGDLEAGDLVLYDDGVAQQVSLFSRGQVPLAVALVVDRSPSIEPYLEELRRAALMALTRLGAEDSVALFAFDGSSLRFSDLTRDHAQIARIIGRIPIGMATNIGDAVFDAADYLRRRAPDRRRAIILVSDNVTTVRPVHKDAETIREVLEAGATLYCLKTRGDNFGNGESSDLVRRITDDSGGEILDAGAAGKLEQALMAAVTNLKSGYTLGFTPSNPGQSGSYHRLVVGLNPQGRCSDCRAQARTGYYYGGNSGLPPPESRGRKPGGPPSQAFDPPADIEDLVAGSRMKEAAYSARDAGQIAFEVTSEVTKDDRGQRQVRINLRIDIAAVGFIVSDGRHVGRLRVTVFCESERGEQLGSEWKTIDMRLLDGTYREFQKTGIAYSTVLPLKASPEIFRVVVYDPATDLWGKRTIRIQ